MKGVIYYKTVPLGEQPYKPPKNLDEKLKKINVCRECNISNCKGTCEKFKR